MGAFHKSYYLYNPTLLTFSKGIGYSIQDAMDWYVNPTVHRPYQSSKVLPIDRFPEPHTSTLYRRL